MICLAASVFGGGVCGSTERHAQARLNPEDVDCLRCKRWLYHHQGSECGNCRYLSGRGFCHVRWPLQPDPGQSSLNTDYLCGLWEAR